MHGANMKIKEYELGRACGTRGTEG